MNQTWKTYGCTKCDKYLVLVIDANIARNDSRTGLQNYITKNNVQYPAVLYGDGGSAWDAALNNQSYGNPQYWIKPDKSIVRQPNVANEISRAGIKPHVCTVDVLAAPGSAEKAGIVIHSIHAGALHCRVKHAGTYTVAAFMSNGKKLLQVQSRLAAGDNHVPLPMAQGLVIVSVSNGAEKAVNRISCVQ